MPNWRAQHKLYRHLQATPVQLAPRCRPRARRSFRRLQFPSLRFIQYQIIPIIMRDIKLDINYSRSCRQRTEQLLSIGITLLVSLSTLLADGEARRVSSGREILLHGRDKTSAISRASQTAIVRLLATSAAVYVHSKSDTDHPTWMQRALGVSLLCRQSPLHE